MICLLKRKIFNKFTLLLAVLAVTLSYSSVHGQSTQPAWQSIYPQDSQKILIIIESLLNTLQSQDYSKAYQQYTSTTFKELTSQEEFAFFITSYPAMINAKNAFFGNVEPLDKRGEIVRIQGNLSSADSSSVRMEFYLLRDGDDWKIEGIQIAR